MYCIRSAQIVKQLALFNVETLAQPVDRHLTW